MDSSVFIHWIYLLYSHMYKKGINTFLKTIRMEGSIYRIYWTHNSEHKLTWYAWSVSVYVKHMKIIMINIQTWWESWNSRPYPSNWTTIFVVPQYILRCVVLIHSQENQTKTKQQQVNQCQKQMKQIYEENKNVWQTICILFHHFSSEETRRCQRRNRK